MHTEQLIIARKAIDLASADAKPHIIRTLAYASRLLPYYKWRKSIRFFFNAAFKADLYREWFDYVEKEFPETAFDNAGCFIQKPSLRYLRLWFSQREKMRIIRSHFSLLNSLFSAEAARLIPQASGVELAALTGKSGRAYTINLHQYATKEGEIALHFMDAELGIMLATIRGTFSLESGNRMVFWIGSLQGPPPPFGRKEISAATRDLYTLRPKQAVLYAVCTLCGWAGVQNIYAPRRQRHVSQSWRRSWFRRRKIFADYDKFWEEYSVRKTPWGDFDISLTLPRRNLPEVKSKRRKEWLRRYAHIDVLTENMTSALDKMGRRPANGRSTRPRIPGLQNELREEPMAPPASD